jgi:hypothetical protein
VVVATVYGLGGRIPDVMLPRAAGGAGGTLPVRGRPREGVALLFPDTGGGWPGYLRRLAALASDLAEWDARVIAVAPADAAHDPAWAGLARELGSSVWIVHDPDRRLRPATPPGDPEPVLPAAAVVDRFGEIYHVWPRDHAGCRPGPEPRELEEWLRFMALQCPE